MLNPAVSLTAGVGDSQCWDCLEFHLTAAAAGTEHSLIPAQRTASARVWTMTGDGSVDMTTARSQDLAKDPNGKLGSTETLIAAQLATYFTNVPAAADGAYAFGFAVGGVTASQVMKAELSILSASTSASNPVRQLKWNTSALKILATSDTPTYGTDTMCISGNVLFGALACGDVTDAPASGESMVLRIWVRG